MFVGLLSALAACDVVQKEADTKFADQNFKTALALIELHKVRYGSYPRDLSSLTYVGQWDVIALSSVEYGLLSNGYELNLKAISASNRLTYPPQFWLGLGLVRSNVKTSK